MRIQANAPAHAPSAARATGDFDSRSTGSLPRCGDAPLGDTEQSAPKEGTQYDISDGCWQLVPPPPLANRVGRVEQHSRGDQEHVDDRVFIPMREESHDRQPHRGHFAKRRSRRERQRSRRGSSGTACHRGKPKPLPQTTGSRPQDLIASLWDAGKWKVCCLASPPSTSMRFVAELSPWRLPWSRAPREPKQEPLLRPPVSRLSPDPELGRESDSRPQASRGVGGVNNRHSRNISSTVLLRLLRRRRFTKRIERRFRQLSSRCSPLATHHGVRITLLLKDNPRRLGFALLRPCAFDFAPEGRCQRKRRSRHGPSLAWDAEGVPGHCYVSFVPHSGLPFRPTRTLRCHDFFSRPTIFSSLVRLQG